MSAQSPCPSALTSPAHLVQLCPGAHAGTQWTGSKSFSLALNERHGFSKLGPSHNPVAPKAAGWQSFVLDHATQADLKEIYREHGVALDRIEPVDFVWAGGAIHDAVPATQHSTFDACIASHVLEHLPDPLASSRRSTTCSRWTVWCRLRCPTNASVSIISGPSRSRRPGSRRLSEKRRGTPGATLWNLPPTRWLTVANTPGANSTRCRFYCVANSNLRRNGRTRLGHRIPRPMSIATRGASRRRALSFSILELGALGLIGFRIAGLFPTYGLRILRVVAQRAATARTRCPVEAPRIAQSDD